MVAVGVSVGRNMEDGRWAREGREALGMMISDEFLRQMNLDVH